MLLSVALPDAPLVALTGGFMQLRREHALVPAAVGWCLFDTPSHLLPAAGQLEVELAATLDGRRYTVRRSLDVADHWQVIDVETGWLAAAGPVEVPHWLRVNLDITEEVPLRQLFRDIVCFSLPVTIAWLLEEPGLGERKTASLLRTDRYRTGVRWLDSVAAGAHADASAAQCAVRLLEGQDRLFDHFRRTFEATRQGSLAAAEALGKARLELGEAEAAQQRLEGLQGELTELQHDIRALRLTLAGLEAQAERWRHWQAVHERAVRGMHEHQPAWQAYQDALVEIFKNAALLAGIEPLRLELHNAAANVMALRREQSLLEGQLAAIRGAEASAADLAERVHQQQQLEQQIGAGQERAIRLELVNRALQQTLQESKRVEVLLSELDRQQAEVEQLAPQAARVKKLQGELEEQQRLAREANKQVDHLRFLEVAARAIGGHLDELRKGSSVTERLAVKPGASAAGAADERGMAGQLREAIDRQMEALERQLRDWQAQSRELAGAPLRQNQLRASMHQLEQELATARQVELKMGAMPALKQHRKYLLDHQVQLKKLVETQIKEQRDCSDAPARLSALRQDAVALKDPRSERQALLSIAARKDGAEAELRQVQRAQTDAEQRQKSLEQRLAALSEIQVELTAQEHRRDDAHEGYCTYLAQQAIAELASSAEPELEAVMANLDAQRRLQEQTEARETALLAAVRAVDDAPLQGAVLRARLEDAEFRADDWKGRFQTAAEEYSAAEENRAALRKGQAELETRARAEALLQSARLTVQEAEAALGRRVRHEAAEGARGYLRQLLGEPAAAITWTRGEPPALSRSGGSHPLGELSPLVQANVALALRLALAADASRFGTVFAYGLGPLLASEETLQRLQGFPGSDQFLVPSAW